jgi:hypothetical protein
MTVPAPGSDLATAEAQAELHALSVEYAAAVDDRDGERLAQLFVAEGELVVPKFPVDLHPVITRSGHEELRQVPDRLAVYDRTFHEVSNTRYAVDGDQASGQVQCVAHHLSPAPGPTGVGTTATDMVWYIRYRDDYRLTGAGWRFARRALHLQWVEEHVVAVLGPSGDGS